MSMLILTKTEIGAVLQPEALLANLRTAFGACSGSSASRSVRLPLPLPS